MAYARTVDLILGAGPQPRGLSDWLSDVAVIQSYYQGEADYTAAFQRAAASNLPIVVPFGTYQISGDFTLPSNGAIVGLGGVPTLQFSGATKMRLPSTVNVYAEAIRFSGGAGVYAAGATDMTFRSCIFDSATGFGINLDSSLRAALYDCTASNNGNTGVYLNNGVQGIVDGLSVINNTGFGIYLSGSANGNLVTNCMCQTNGLELIGMTSGAYRNRLTSNHAEGTGDNGISISGVMNTAEGNVVIGCKGNGINLYGERNSVVGNILLNNAQGNAGNAAWRAGISISSGFGGIAQYNTVLGNVIDDDQSVKTQLFGIYLTAGYTAWASGQSISATGQYRYNGANLYVSASTGTTGATAPTHTSGTVSDGGVQWTFVRTALSSTCKNDYNKIGPNTIPRFGTSALQDLSTATNNLFTGNY